MVTDPTKDYGYVQRLARAHGVPQKIDEVVLTGLWVLFSLLLALCASCLLCSLLYFVLLLWSLRRSAPLVLFGGCEGRPSCLSPRTSCLGAPSAPPDRGSPWEPSRDCLPDEIADERVADGMREWRRSVAELDDKNKE